MLIACVRSKTLTASYASIFDNNSGNRCNANGWIKVGDVSTQIVLFIKETGGSVDATVQVLLSSEQGGEFEVQEGANQTVTKGTIKSLKVSTCAEYIKIQATGNGAIVSAQLCIYGQDTLAPNRTLG